MGARGNSGVILSQIVRGAADVLGDDGDVDATAVARAFRGASDAAYRAVRRPVEGTMLTVVRELAEEAELPATPALPVDELLARSSRHGEDARRTDARAARRCSARRASSTRAAPACVEIVRGIAAAVSGEPLPEPRRDGGARRRGDPPGAVALPLLHRLRGRGRGARRARRSSGELEPLGDSLLVVGDPSALKVHVHTDDPGAALGRRHGGRRGRAASRSRTCTGRRCSARSGCSRAFRIPSSRSRRASSRSSPGAGNSRLFASLRRDASDRGRPDDEPVDRRHRRRDRGHARRRRCSSCRTTRT